MEVGMIILTILMALAGIFAALAIATHVFEWRLTAQLAKAKKEKADLEKAHMEGGGRDADCKDSVTSPGFTVIPFKKPEMTQDSQAQSAFVSGSYAPLTSPKSAMSTSTPTSPISRSSVSFGDILIITSPKMPSAPELAHSPMSTCSFPSPVTPYTPLTPPTTSGRASSGYPMPPSTTAAVPLLSQPSSSLLLKPQLQQAPLPKKYTNDPYTYVAPRVSGSRIRRYATPPSHLRVTIPDRNTKLFERSHRRLPSETTITAPPRLLARSISELVGEDEGEEQTSLPTAIKSDRSIFNSVQAAENNVHEIGRLGW